MKELKMQENTLLNWFGTDPFEAGRILMEKSGQWEMWNSDDVIGLKPQSCGCQKSLFRSNNPSRFRGRGNKFPAG